MVYLLNIFIVDADLNSSPAPAPAPATNTSVSGADIPPSPSFFGGDSVATKAVNTLVDSPLLKPETPLAICCQYFLNYFPNL